VSENEHESEKKGGGRDRGRGRRVERASERPLFVSSFAFCYVAPVKAALFFITRYRYGNARNQSQSDERDCDDDDDRR